jgi:hypothetical protein
VTAPYINADTDADSTLYTYAPEQIEISTGECFHSDPFDLSLTELPTASCPFLRLPQHLAFDIRKGERSLLVGFPARSKSWEIDQTMQTVKPAPLCYLSDVLKTYKERFSVVLSRKHVRCNGQKLQRLGKLNGISGGGVFVLRKDTPKLAGIVIEYHSNSAEIVCISSMVIWEMVRELGGLLKSQPESQSDLLPPC